MPPMNHDDILESIRLVGESVAQEQLLRCMPSGQAQEIAENIGINTAAEIGEIWGGSPVYFPKNPPARRALIYDSFTGNNIRELARRFHFSERNIRMIISAERKRRQDEQDEQKEQDNRQLTFPGL